MRSGKWLLGVLAWALLLSASPSAKAAADEFYQGKTLRFVVGFAPGGGFDTYTRVIARHMGRHIPGNPNTIVENMTGAGSLIAANYVYGVAKPDGLTIGNFIGPVVLQQALGNPGAKFDGRNFGWLGAPTGDSVVCALTRASGIKTVQDWLTAKRPVKIGGTGPGSTTIDVPKIVAAAIKLPTDVIAGFKGTSGVRLAAEGGEIDGGCWAWESIKPTWGKAIDAGEVSVVLQTTLESHPELKQVPLAVQYAKDEQARDLLRIIDGPYGRMARPYSVPPGTPKERLQVLQRAFMATLKDPKFLADAEKSRLEINPIDAPTIEKMIADLYKMSPELRAELTPIVLPGK
jgi:tripartite-type tricarboxylate transporter receptor subunit TctC